MGDPAVLITLLKVALAVVMLGGAVAIAREIVPMARGKVPGHVRHNQSEH